MIKHAYYFESNSVNPHVNLALEEALFDNLKKDSIIFYLWQNAYTVVIGKNQNAHKECDIKKMKENNCTLARRSTGGGAVYHDLGNLNFTIISSSEDHSIYKQSQVIIEALKTMGIIAELSSRNDIEIDGKKVSGNAYLTKNNKKLHHGTIMLNVDVKEMSKYLRPSKLKLKTKGVDSVRSRVCNVNEYVHVTSKQMIEKLKESFEKVYGLQLETIKKIKDYEEYLRKYESEEFVYGSICNYTDYYEERYAFGEVNIYYTIDENNEVSNVVVYTDSMDDRVSKRIDELFVGIRRNFDLVSDEKDYLKMLLENLEKEYLEEKMEESK